MNISYFYLAMVIGIGLSLLVEEFTGINAGGSICPGFFAMILDDIPTICLILCCVLLTYLVINYVLPHFMIIYGKRRFTASIIVSMFFKLLFELFFPILPFATVMFRGIGTMSTGVLANNCTKQGFRYTLPACAAVTIVTFGIVQLIALTGIIS